MSDLLLDAATRASLWTQVCDETEKYLQTVGERPLFHGAQGPLIREALQGWQFDMGREPKDAIAFVTDQLHKNHLHTSHPAYFGVFNPRPSSMGIFADTLVAAFNPQLASWQSAPFAVELEDHLLKCFGKKFGFAYTEGTFTSGGMEANHTALITALVRRFPQFNSLGVRGIDAEPLIYVSSEAHHSFLKAARMCGLGQRSLRVIKAGSDLKMSIRALTSAIDEDLTHGRVPLMIVGTLGTTSAGVIDPLNDLARVARRFHAWFHVDGAWGAASLLSAKVKAALPHVSEGLSLADSITFDAHKWLSVPMGAGMFMTRHQGILKQAFCVSTSYMPTGSLTSELPQPYSESMQWSRRFIGLKLFLTLAVSGFAGYEQIIDRQIELGDILRQKLKFHGWLLKNETSLPVVCFGPKEKLTQDEADELARQVALTGKTWITTAKINDTPVLRAGIANYLTSEKDLDVLVETLNDLAGRRDG